MAVPVGLKVGGFALAIMGSYSWFANSIPQIESKPPEELSLEGGNVTPQQLVAAGEKIFREKGTVHDLPRHRAGRPRTRSRRGRGPRRHAEARDQGRRLPGRVAAQARRLRRRGLPQHHAGRVAAADQPEPERAVGDRRLPPEPRGHGGREAGRHPARWRPRRRAAAASIELPGDPKAGQAVFVGKGACVACHKAGAVGASPVGPDLSHIAGSQTPEYIMGKILDPGVQGRGVGLPAERDAEDVRADAHGQGVPRPDGVHADPQVWGGARRRAPAGAAPAAKPKS